MSVRGRAGRVRAISSVGRAFGSHPKGRRFEPCIAQSEGDSACLRASARRHSVAPFGRSRVDNVLGDWSRRPS
jgi:hypothetical protein